MLAKFFVYITIMIWYLIGKLKGKYKDDEK